jgi:hypothetical protein
MTCPCCRGAFQHSEDCTIRKEAAALVAGHGLPPQLAEMTAAHGWERVQQMKRRYEQSNSGAVSANGRSD